MDSLIAEVKIYLNREKIGNLPTQKKSILKNAAKWSILLGAVTIMINPRITANWGTTKQIAPFSCTPRVQ